MTARFHQNPGFTYFVLTLCIQYFNNNFSDFLKCELSLRNKYVSAFKELKNMQSDSVDVHLHFTGSTQMDPYWQTFCGTLHAYWDNTNGTLIVLCLHND